MDLRSYSYPDKRPQASSVRRRPREHRAIEERWLGRVRTSRGREKVAGPCGTSSDLNRKSRERSEFEKGGKPGRRRVKKRARSRKEERDEPSSTDKYQDDDEQPLINELEFSLRLRNAKMR